MAASARLLAQVEPPALEDHLARYQSNDGLQDPVARLRARLAHGNAKLEFKPGRGYLDSLLHELQVPVSSQTLVFSKTSSQADHTSPQTPRAIYFSDNVYIGWVPGADLIDLAAVDPERGPIFYTLAQRHDIPLQFSRPADCMQCHLGPKTMHVPGLLVRSIYTASNGTPVSQVLGFVNGHNSPLAERWGGWYVTGTHSRTLHLGNLFVTNSAEPSRLDLSAGANVTDLRTRFDTKPYLSPHSDIVALLILEHEVRMHNLITRAQFETLSALDQERAEANRKDKSDWPRQRIVQAGERLLEYMLFRDEARLAGPVRGTSGFAKDFEKGGPLDSRGRSLRQLDLTARLLRYPCSYLIYSHSFDALPQRMKQYLWERLNQILSGKDQGPAYASMPNGDREAVLGILTETKPEFAAWRNQRGGSRASE